MSIETQTREMSTAMELDALDIRPNPWNKVRPLDPAFVASVASQGILSPILVRPTDDGGKGYEIICGHRRWMAACETGMLMIPAVMRVMDDQEAQICTLIENTHREDMTPWQEAQLIGDLLSRPDWDIAQAAAATGWSESMIRRRAKLLELSPSWRKVIEEKEFPAWTIGHFEILAIFEERRQEDLFKEVKYRANGMTVADLKEAISNSSQLLKSAPWDLEDVALLPKAGACVGCSTRSDAQSDLFGQVPEMVKAGASCLDDGCFKKKLAAHVKRKEAALLDKHPDAIKVATDWNAGGKGVLRSHEFDTAKKGDKGAVAAIQYGEGGKVSLGYVKVKKSAQEKDQSPKAKAKEAERKRLAQVEALAIDKLIAIVEDPTTEFTDEAYDVLVQYCLVHGIGIEIDDEEAADKRVRAYAKKPVTADELWVGAAHGMIQSLNRVKWGLERGFEGSQEEAPEVKLAAWMVDADFAALRKEAAEEIAAVPAADLATDGDDSADLDDGLDGESEGDL